VRKRMAGDMGRRRSDAPLGVKSRTGEGDHA
jgi:hypothetical protein